MQRLGEMKGFRVASDIHIHAPVSLREQPYVILAIFIAFFKKRR
jgi:hypothetical protein